MRGTGNRVPLKSSKASEAMLYGRLAVVTLGLTDEIISIFVSCGRYFKALAHGMRPYI